LGSLHYIMQSPKFPHFTSGASREQGGYGHTLGQTPLYQRASIGTALHPSGLTQFGSPGSCATRPSGFYQSGAPSCLTDRTGPSSHICSSNYLPSFQWISPFGSWLLMPSSSRVYGSLVSPTSTLSTRHCTLPALTPTLCALCWQISLLSPFTFHWSPFLPRRLLYL
jgi:hypothetical protein